MNDNTKLEANENSTKPPRRRADCKVHRVRRQRKYAQSMQAAHPMRSIRITASAVRQANRISAEEYRKIVRNRRPGLTRGGQTGGCAGRGDQWISAWELAGIPTGDRRKYYCRKYENGTIDFIRRQSSNLPSNHHLRSPSIQQVGSRFRRHLCLYGSCQHIHSAK